MSTWNCRSCGKRECIQFAESRPSACIDAIENHNHPLWTWVSEDEYGKPIEEIPGEQSEFAAKVSNVLHRIGDMLIEKNRKYGNAALEPVRIFAKSDSLEQIRVRLDDKLNRIKNRQNDEDEDVIDDLIGYLILYKIKEQENGQ